MKRRGILSIVAFCWAGCFAISSGSDDISVMTFNVRYGLAEDGDHHWSIRGPLAVQTVEKYSPDILGLQEALRFQLDVFLAANEDYLAVGEARDGNGKGEYAPILFKQSKFHLLNTGTFWLSDTPKIPSASWGNHFKRICSWAHLKRIDRADTFFVFNTHWDHQSVQSRDYSAKILTQKINEIAQGNAFFVMGDFNATINEACIQHLLKQEIVPLQLHEFDPGNTPTFHGYASDAEGLPIDFIFSSTHWVSTKSQIIMDRYDQIYPSDHFPVFIENMQQR